MAYTDPSCHQRDACHYYAPRGDYLFLMSGRQILNYSVRQILLYYAPRSECLLSSKVDPCFPCSARQMLICYVPRGGRLFLMSVQWTFIFSHIPQDRLSFTMFRKAEPHLITFLDGSLSLVHRKTDAHLSHLKTNPYFMSHDANACSCTPRWMIISYDSWDRCLLLCFQNDLYYSPKRIFIYDALLGRGLVFMFTKRIFVHNALRHGCLFCMTAKWILIYYHGLRSRSLLHSATWMLIPHTLRGRWFIPRSTCLLITLREAGAYLSYSMTQMFLIMLRGWALISYTPLGGSLHCPQGECMSLALWAMSRIPSFFKKWTLYSLHIPVCSVIRILFSLFFRAYSTTPPEVE